MARPSLKFDAGFRRIPQKRGRQDSGWPREKTQASTSSGALESRVSPRREAGPSQIDRAKYMPQKDK
eukprot:2932186-Pyramimonas_sp.AAC.1